MKIIWICILLLVFDNFFVLCSESTRTRSNIKEQITNTGLLADKDDLLFIATLDGALHAVTKETGIKKWTLKDAPVFQNPNDSDLPPMPHFFPNPQDGTLYRYTVGRDTEPLKKLPFTIPELVANSPCRSSDGILYYGKKVDSWVGVDVVTGKKQLVLGTESIEKVCPKPSRNTIYLGRTMYNIVLFELNTGNKWNVTFYHYSSSLKPDNYDLIHYAAAGEGSVLTVNKKTGAPLWNLELHSPVVAMYLLAPDNSLATIPLITVNPQTLDQFFINDLSKVDPNKNSKELLLQDLRPSIFIAETIYGVYALPTFVDTHTPRISKKQSQLLLDGPPGQRGVLKQETDVKNDEDNVGENNSNVLLLGYYDIPEEMQENLNKLSPNELGTLSSNGILLGITHEMNITKNDQSEKHAQSKDWNEIMDGWVEISNLNMTFLLSRDSFMWSYKFMKISFTFIISHLMQFMILIITICLILIAVILYRQAKEYARLSQEVSSRKQNTSSKGSSGGGSFGSEITAVAEELDGGGIKVGKIIFKPDHLLGKGCDGTFVFRGSFDGRDVAVKRVLPSCFSIADREVDLLRTSDQHPHVIRYYCMEQCREFRYIALELCAATLDDFICGKFSAVISPLLLLRQATLGLHHLHSLDIVHRDIKPHNVLLSLPNSKGEVRAMISDFGLCKQLEVGKTSFSKRSGVTGTEGWIAPEMLQSTTRPTTKVDIFSMGCVFYFVLTKGKHPFGSVLDRQSNILSGKFDLSELGKDVDVLFRSLVEKMIGSWSDERPPTSAILSHPMFWSPDRILQFFQDVSDRIEKETVNSVIVRNLESGAFDVVREDWTKHIHPSIGEDLRKFREYNGRSVRDLLRALRNKKNHYRELPDEARRVFGRIPEEFVPYWTDRFPRLLLHSWLSLQCCKGEQIFNKYYSSRYSFRAELPYQMVSLSPNNRPNISLEASTDFYKPKTDFDKSPTRQKQYGKNKDPYSFIDTILGSPIGKGSRKHLKQEKQDSPIPKWVLKKPVNTFEPQFSSVSQPIEIISEDKEERHNDKVKSNDDLKSTTELSPLCVEENVLQPGDNNKINKEEKFDRLKGPELHANEGKIIKTKKGKKNKDKNQL